MFNWWPALWIQHRQLLSLSRVFCPCQAERCRARAIREERHLGLFCYLWLNHKLEPDSTICSGFGMFQTKTVQHSYLWSAHSPGSIRRLGITLGVGDRLQRSPFLGWRGIGCCPGQGGVGLSWCSRQTLKHFLQACLTCLPAIPETPTHVPFLILKPKVLTIKFMLRLPRSDTDKRLSPSDLTGTYF